MNSLINYQEAGSNLITIPATRRACLCPRRDTSRVYLRPKGSVLPRRRPGGAPWNSFSAYRQASVCETFAHVAKPMESG